MADVSLDLIRRLRAKADASTFTAEAELFRAKADELSIRRARRPRAVGLDSGAPALPARGDEDGLAHWRTPVWWLVQSGSLRDSSPKTDLASGW